MASAVHRTAEKTREGAEHFDVPAMIQDMVTYIGTELARNSLVNYLIAFAIAAGGIVLIWLVKGVIAKVATRWLSSMDKLRVDNEMAEDVGSTLVPLLYLFPLFFALDTLDFSAVPRRVISFLIFVLFITHTVRFFSALASFATDIYLRRHQESLDSVVGRTLSPIIRVLFWTIGITIILDNMGFQISSLLAGLGIVGVAVGLAGQTILADFFGYLVILLDRPFCIGDYILTSSSAGTVESIGLKTTRLRTASGEVVVCPNGDLTKQYISNYRLMYRRQRSFTFGVAYETPVAALRAIPGMVGEAANHIKALSIDRVFFTQFGDSSLNYEVTFSVPGRSHDEAMAAQQELCLSIMERFGEEGIVFSSPTRKLYFANAVPDSIPGPIPGEGGHA